MLRHAISHARLMRESTDRIEAALVSHDANEQLVARRILENPIAWSHWESEHSLLMRQLANCGVRQAQIATLRHTAFRLLHGKALFHYLRGHTIRGSDRIEIMAHFRPGRHYVNAIIAEHTVYLRRACSYLCATHVGGAVVSDPAFLDPIPRYEELYNEYFEVYCSSLVKAPEEDAASQVALLPLLKKQLNEYRWAIMDPRQAQPFLRREADLRRPSGDTQRMPALRPRQKPRR
jgi:hypothetical protein